MFHVEHLSEKVCSCIALDITNCDLCHAPSDFGNPGAVTAVIFRGGVFRPMIRLGIRHGPAQRAATQDRVSSAHLGSRPDGMPVRGGRAGQEREPERRRVCWVFGPSFAPGNCWTCSTVHNERSFASPGRDRGRPGFSPCPSNRAFGESGCQRLWRWREPDKPQPTASFRRINADSRGSGSRYSFPRQEIWQTPHWTAGVLAT